MRPLAIELFAGLHGWGAGLSAAGFRVVGFDIENMPKLLGQEIPPHCDLVLQDVRTLCGRQFKDAAIIVASPPCQAYSYRAMPWKRAKALPPPSNELFDACFRIQREACEAAGHHIPMVVENVRGAQPWVGRAKWHYGSFYLWGDVPALMPLRRGPLKGGDRNKNRAEGHAWTSSFADTIGQKNTGGSWFGINPDGTPGALNNARDGQKVPAFRFDGSGRSFQSAAVAHADGIKASEDQRGGDRRTRFDGGLTKHGSKSSARKAASAMIAKIPLPLSTWIGKTYYPRES